ncbi:hypothetical protein H0H93_002053 [Arthromyces matolae]|nr:hypothetical protein H0H93_002053 [Arthromyces matolae]
MNPEIIDLTEPEANNLNNREQTATPVSSEPEKKKSRRRKRKRALTDGDSASAAQTREPSAEEGEVQSESQKDDIADGSTGGQSGKRRKSREKTHRERISPQIPIPLHTNTDTHETIFYVDLEPVPLPTAAQLPSTSNSIVEKTHELLLPEHVSVFGEPAEILVPQIAESDEDFIDYLDFDDNSKNITRYFDDPLPETSKTNKTECPTLWRLYEYLAEEARTVVIKARNDKQTRRLGEGGEGYIGEDEWCYNCGNFGHWGDDCEDLSYREDIPDEYSAFSEHNTLSGPFFDSDRDRSTRHREDRELDPYSDLPPSWGNVPENVGRRGRRDNAAKMERKAREQAEEEDTEDWFGKPQSARNRSTKTKSNDRKSNPPKKLTFGKTLQESTKHFRSPSPPKLLDRIGDVYCAGRPSERQRVRDSKPTNSRHRRDDRSTLPTRDRDSVTNFVTYPTKKLLLLGLWLLQEHMLSNVALSFANISSTASSNASRASTQRSGGPQAVSVLTRTTVSLEYAALRHHLHCPLGMYIVPSVEDLLVWNAVFFVHQGAHGPSSSLLYTTKRCRLGYYAGAILKFCIVFPPTYPDKPPEVQLATDVFHPLIDNVTGAFSMSPRFKPWRPHEHRIFHVLHYIKAAFKKNALDEIQEMDCLNKEAFRL